MTDERQTPAWLRRYTKLTAAATLFLIYAGAMVTSTGSGLAVPDWPLSYGMLFPPMVGGIFYEHGHRMIAATVGLLTLIQAFWLQRSEPKGFLRRLGWVALVAVVVQGLLGGLTVIYLLPTAVSVSHAGLAEIFFCLNLSIAFFASRTYSRLRRQEEGVSEGIVFASRVLLAALFIQILLGALMRHLGAGLAIPDFPLSFGRLVPALTTAGIAATFSHRVGAVILVVFVAGFARRMFSTGNRFVAMIYTLMIGVLTSQVVLGAFTVWNGRPPILTSLHVVTGASLLGLGLLLALGAQSLLRSEKPSIVGLTHSEASA